MIDRVSSVLRLCEVRNFNFDNIRRVVLIS